jgi:hypothetical protein
MKNVRNLKEQAFNCRSAKISNIKLRVQEVKRLAKEKLDVNKS